jgi:hypothetical protein
LRSTETTFPNWSEGSLPGPTVRTGRHSVRCSMRWTMPSWASIPAEPEGTRNAGTIAWEGDAAPADAFRQQVSYEDAGIHWIRGAACRPASAAGRVGSQPNAVNAADYDDRLDVLWLRAILFIEWSRGGEPDGPGEPLGARLKDPARCISTAAVNRRLGWCEFETAAPVAVRSVTGRRVSPRLSRQWM